MPHKRGFQLHIPTPKAAGRRLQRGAPAPRRPRAAPRSVGRSGARPARESPADLRLAEGRLSSTCGWQVVDARGGAGARGRGGAAREAAADRSLG